MNAWWWVVWAAVVVAFAWQVRRALREPLERDRIVAEARRRTAPLEGIEHDVGPDALQLLQDTDEFLDGLVANDPEMAAGFDRLRAAIRDEQQKGETP